MKTITRIARTELASLFFSPIAWFILVVFSVITGYGFWDLLQSVAGHEYDISVTQLLFMDRVPPSAAVTPSQAAMASRSSAVMPLAQAISRVSRLLSVKYWSARRKMASAEDWKPW